MRRQPALDGVRGIAILLVLIHHFYTFTPNVLFHKLAHAGWVGVDLFFVLSGFLITGILLDSRDQQHYFRNFYARRFIRICPLWYSLLAFVFLVLPFTGKGDWIWGGNIWPWYIFYINNFRVVTHSWRMGNPIDIAWSLAIEEQFYILWPAIVLFLGRRLWLLGMILVLLSLAIRCWLWIHYETWLYPYVLTPARLDGLSSGAILAVIHRSAPHTLPRWGIAAFVTGLLMIAWVVMQQGDFYLTSTLSLTVGISAASILFFGLISLVLSTPWLAKACQLPLLQFLGKYSYGIYLLHMWAQLVIDRLAARYGYTSRIEAEWIWQIAYQALLYLITMSLALISWIMLERPASRLKTFFDKPATLDGVPAVS